MGNPVPRITRTVTVEGVEVGAVVEHVRRWHDMCREDVGYVGIRVVAPTDEPRHCTVAIDFESPEGASACNDATDRLIGEFRRIAAAVPAITTYQRLYTSREDAPS
jgi:hypothetical protein